MKSLTSTKEEGGWIAVIAALFGCMVGKICLGAWYTIGALLTLRLWGLI